MNRFIFLVMTLTLMGTVSSHVPVISSYEIADLELVCKNSTDNGDVVRSLDKTVTKAGSLALKRLLTQPVVDVNVIKARQALIQKLRDPAVRALIEQHLQTIAQHEERMQRCFEKGFQEQTETALHENYFSLSRLKKYNTSPAALEFNNVGQFMLIFMPLLELGLFHGPFARWLGTSCNHDHSSHDHHDHHHHDHDHCHTGGCCGHKPEFSLKKAFKNVLVYGHGALGVIAFLKLAKDYWNRIKVVDGVHQSMISVNAAIKASVEISRTLAKSGVKASLIEADYLMDIQLTDPALVKQSSDSRFNDNKDNHLFMFSPVGKTLSSFALVCEEQKKVEQLLSAVGSIDAMLSIAKVMDEPQSVYNFVTLRDGSNPYVSLENFVHPQLATSGVKNSVVLGDNNNPKKLVITGPNKAGKSSVTKAIAVNCVLAQTFGIVAASSGTITPMHRIITYINIHDNLAGDASRMVAELKRTDQALEALKDLEGKAPTLCLFDDSLFKSTHSQEGELLAYRFVKKLASFTSAIVFVVTHYESLSKLEADTAGAMVNYRIGLQKDAAGNVTSTYQLEQGVSPRDAIFSIIKQGYDLPAFS